MINKYKKLEKEILKEKEFLHKIYEQKEKNLLLALSYKFFDELFDTKLKTQNIPLVEQSFFDYLDKVFDTISVRSKVVLSVEVLDGYYTKEQLGNFVENNIRLHVFELLLQDKKQKRNSALLCLFGGLLLLFSFWCGKMFSVFLISDAFNTIGSILIWSGVDIFFIERNRDRLLSLKYTELLAENNYSVS